MSEWKTVRLGDYITEYSVKNKSNEDIPVYSVTNTQGFCTEYFSKDVSSKDKSNYKIVPRGCFAYNPSRINVGSVDWQRYEDRVIVSPLYNVFKVLDTNNLEIKYFMYYLKSNSFKKQLFNQITGSAQLNFGPSHLIRHANQIPIYRDVWGSGNKFKKLEFKKTWRLIRKYPLWNKYTTCFFKNRLCFYKGYKYKKRKDCKR